MKRKRRHKETSAKSLVFDPLFRPRQEAAKKGKGSYARRPRNQSTDAGPFSFYDVSGAARAENTLRPVHARTPLRRRRFFFMTFPALPAPKTRYVRYMPVLRSAAGAFSS